MGFILFTQSGTFDPAIYGLKAGDVLHVKAVGGGGGGGCYYYLIDNNLVGSKGSASSFGSVLTAAGGLAGGPMASQTIVAGSNPGGNSCTLEYKGYVYCCGGTGGDGWMPGYSGASGLPVFLLVPRTMQSADSTTEFPLFYDTTRFHVNRELTISFASTLQYVTSAVNTLPYGHAGKAHSANSNYIVMCAGGVGYGAGGGTGTSGPNNATNTTYGYGGNGGVIADTNYVLPDTSPIDVTVGAGGFGHSSGGGGGANGCVAIWW